MSHGHDSSGGGFAGGMMGSMVAILLVALLAIVILFVAFNWRGGDDGGAAPDVPDANGVPNGDANGNGDGDDAASYWFQQDPGYRLIS